MKTETILGIDPGFSVTGYAIIQKNGTKAQLIDYGYLRLPVKEHLSKRVEQFYDFLNEKAVGNMITSLAIETPFLGKNVQSFLKLGYLRGVLYLLAAKHDLSLHEFSPREVKAAVTGYGAASKDQVAMMVMRLFPKISAIKAVAKQDVTDAVAVCLAGFWGSEKQTLSRLKQYKK